jgi:hypothetical protein
MELSPIPPRAGKRPIGKKGAGSRFIFGMGLLYVPVTLLINYGIIGDPFRKALIHGLIMSATFLITSYIVLLSERKKAAGK